MLLKAIANWKKIDVAPDTCASDYVATEGGEKDLPYTLVSMTDCVKKFCTDSLLRVSSTGSMAPYICTIRAVTIWLDTGFLDGR